MEVAEPNFRRATRMQLQGENAFTTALGIIQVDAHCAVDASRDLRTDRLNHVGVPLAALNVSFAALIPQQCTSMFLV